MNMKPDKKHNPPYPPLDDNTTSCVACQDKKTLDKDTIIENYKINVYSHCIEFFPSSQYKHQSNGNHSPRGKISHFTKRSRFRLFSLLAKIDDNLPRQPIFISLTYHYGHIDKKNRTKNQLHNFLVQLRNFDHDVQFIWRIELQERKAPHYHLIIFPGPVFDRLLEIYYLKRISYIWHMIADPKSRKHSEFGCKSTMINSYKQACVYLSKYVAKESSAEKDIIEGKHWGCSRNLPIKIKTKIELNERESERILNRIRTWLIRNGKIVQADPNYLNIFNTQTIFIDESEFFRVISHKEPFY